MKKLDISPKISFSLSSFISVIFVIYFAYKAFLAYVIYKELYGSGSVDVIVALRCAFAAAMIFLTFLFFQFMRIKDLKSQRTILKGTFIGWSSICITLIIVTPNFIYFIILTGLASIISLLSSIGLIKKINEERNSLTEKEIYLLQKLANKK
jgi:hypothetical protein|tara:strand:- start:14 stop:469 length:456 start_codon:yes stop_codon:yes gene_type:complete